MIRLRSLIGCLLCVGAGACGSSESASDAGSSATEAARDERVILGTGEADFEPIDGEPRLTLVAGVQGGFHVWASFRVYGVTGQKVDMTLETTVEDDPDTRLVMHARIDLREGVDDLGIPVRTFAGFPAQIQDARCAQDKRISVQVELADGSGAQLTDTRHCIADVPEQQRREDCE